MEQDKLALAKVLGEIYRVQKEQGICQVSDHTIYGLLNGFEQSINSELVHLGYISEAEVELVADYFDPYWKHEQSIEDLPGYKTVEMDLERKGIRPAKFHQILKFLYANDRYTTEIDKLGRSMALSSYDV